MSQIKVNGAVVKEVPTGEGDRMITVIAEKIGKIYVYVNGARRTRSRISAATDFLAWSEFLLYKKGGKYRLNSCEIIESFYSLREDIVSLTYAAYLAEIITDMFQEEQENDELLRLYLNTLSFLAKKKKDNDLLAAVFKFRAVCIGGYMPILDCCTVCGSALKSGEVYGFSEKMNGIVCEKCMADVAGAIKISQGTLRLMLHTAFCEENRVFSFEATGDVLSEFSKVADIYIEYINEKSYNKLEYLRKL